MASDSLDGDRDDVPKPAAHVRHYPIDVLDIYGGIDKYEHRRITASDILVHRLMSHILNPSPSVARLLLQQVSPTSVHSLASKSPASNMLVKDFYLLESLVFSMPMYRANNRSPCGPTVNDRIVQLVARYYLENDDSALRVWVSRAKPPRMPSNYHSGEDGGTTGRDRKQKQLELRLKLKKQMKLNMKTISPQQARHLHSIRSKIERTQISLLYDGGTSIAQFRKYQDQLVYSLHGPRKRMNDTHWVINDGNVVTSVLPPWPPQFPPIPCVLLHLTHGYLATPGLKTSGENGLYICPWDLFSDPAPRRSRHRPELPPRRSRSEPPWGAWGGYTLAKLPEPLGYPQQYHVYFPTMTLSEMDRRSRRRSLSRRHIEDMFIQRNTSKNSLSELEPIFGPDCKNCKDLSHETAECNSPCGFCGAPGRFSFDEAFWAMDDLKLELEDFDPCGPGYHQEPHFAPTCTLARGNRCKCLPFPTFHTADRCGVPCRRDCGNKHRTGSFQHKNAMTCRSRCCMCGIRGHSGKECRLKKCRCGGAHLGQDCGWNPTCRIGGCDRYLCGKHCQECGSLERPFIGKRCWKCLGFSEPLEHPQGRNARRRNKRLSKEEGAEGTENAEKVDNHQNESKQEMEEKEVGTADVLDEATKTITSEPSSPPPNGENKGQQSIIGDPRVSGTSNRIK